MYIKRTIENTISKLEKMYKAILVTGPRQVGKTTLLKNYKKGLPILNFDDAVLRGSIIDNPHTFFLDNKMPLIMDEIQRVPELFLQLKFEIDKNEKKGQCFLSGSQSFLLMKNVSESLAGRLGIVNLLGLSQREKHGFDYYDKFLPTSEYISKRKNIEINYDLVWEDILRGSSPELFVEKDYDRIIFYKNLISEYIDRDVRDLTQVGDLVKFNKLIILLASNVSNLLNINHIANELQLSFHTVERYISILESSHIIYLLKPYDNTMSTRLIKSSKIYFLDTGLLCTMLGWNSTETLKNGPMAGAIFENYVISEIIKSFYNAGDINPNLYFYRDKDMKEIDLIIEDNATLYPVEIKKHADPSKNDIINFKVLNKFKNITVGEGCLISMYDKVITLDSKIYNIPVAYI